MGGESDGLASGLLGRRVKSNAAKPKAPVTASVHPYQDKGRGPGSSSTIP